MSLALQQARRLSGGSLGMWGRLDHLDLEEAIRVVQWCETSGLAAFWTPEVLGREPMVLQAVLSGSTRSILLGTAVANVYARDTATTRAAAATLSELSGGRFVLGLGVSHAEFVEGHRGLIFGAPLATMRAHLRGYETTPYAGPTPFGEPLILLGALRKAMLGLAATVGGAFGYFAPVNWVSFARATLDAARPEGAPRPLLAVTMPVVATEDARVARTTGRAYAMRALELSIYRAVLGGLGYTVGDLTDGGSDRLIDDVIAWGHHSQIRNRLEAIRGAGADHVALVPLAPDGKTLNATSLAGLGPLLRELR